MSYDDKKRPRKAVIVGAGPVGCLAAMALAKVGWIVEIYEGRPDIRLHSPNATGRQRSINLAISSRGITAVQAIDYGAAERFLDSAIPMRGRMVHDADGNRQSQAYDRDGQCINSIDRTIFNKGLLEEALRMENIRVYFEHKVQTIDFDRKEILVCKTGESVNLRIDFDFCIGADGSYSVVRRQMMRVVRMDYHQVYIRHEYLELRMPPILDAMGTPSFALDPNHLHIWPRHSYMLIALPNKDKSFTCTLFASITDFDRLTPDNFVSWFKSNFPDALTCIGENALLNDFLNNPRSPLISTQSTPYHYKDRAIILGDAAHSMVPFYGQGLNCGLEDVRVLSALFKEEGVECLVPQQQDSNFIDARLARVLDRYSENRHEDMVAICELAMENYVEMRHDVTTPIYLLRKALDNVLYSLTTSKTSPGMFTQALSQTPFPPRRPLGWLPLYTMVTFRPDISYATARRVAKRQARILTGIIWSSTAALGVGLALLSFWIRTGPRNQVQ